MAISFQIIERRQVGALWGVAAVYLIVTAPAAPALKASAAAMMVLGATMLGLEKATKEDRNSPSEASRAAVLANKMKYDLYHGFWHAALGTVFFLMTRG